MAPYLVSSIFNLFKPKNNSQIKLLKDPNSIKMNDFLLNGGIPVTLYSNMLTFRDSNKSFKLDGDLLETMTNYDFNVSHSNPQHQKLKYELAKELDFIIKQTEQKGNRDKSLIILVKSPTIQDSGISRKILSSDHNEPCERIKILIQEKQVCNLSNIIDGEIITIVDKLLEYKCLSVVRV